ncbi:TlpA family protein disulfide reductase [Pedobacter metabolipauper]|uniref:Peroxiredoxin n=1 Tax=Pedobacter metabolipauper TaxID=425513 RepID=A0A4R6SVF1_9SPHI|nr:TlpA disulfide reductase family protein [Pedobacter metabolipauper]TDQ09760.1 peroxiredoxin [Pedobacter metabolipauper]
MKRLIILFLLLGTIPAVSFGQNDSTYFLQGNIRNYDQSSFNLVNEGFFEWKDYNILVDNKGNFSKKIRTEGIQNFILRLNNETITLFAVPGDTITLKWDNKNIAKTLTVRGKSKERTMELQTKIELFYLAQKISDGPDQKTSDTAKYRAINNAFNQEIMYIHGVPHTENFDKIAYDIYYKYMNMLLSARLHDKFKLTITDNLVRDAINKKIPTVLLDYKLINEFAFNKSALYRKFIYDWVRLYRIFDGAVAINSIKSNHVKTHYLLGQAVIDIQRIKDWYAAVLIKDGFESSEFSNTVEIYNQYLQEGKTPEFKVQLTKYYTNLKNLSPGQSAPGFSLKDMDGNTVSLNDFLGKLVYIDFWGVHCGPCRKDILDNGFAVHEKYKDKEVVFVNICTDETEKPWKKATGSLNLKGVNLIVEKPNDSAVSKDYNVNSIPRYVLVGKDGKIILSTAPGLWELARETENILDVSLKN